MNKKNEVVTMRVEDFKEPESSVRDDYSKPTFAELEMKEQGAKAYAYNARRTVKPEPVKSNHGVFWFRKVHLPVFVNKMFGGGKGSRPAGQKGRDRSLVIVLATLAAVAVLLYVSSNWFSISRKIEGLFSREPDISYLDNSYSSSEECVEAFISHVLRGDAAAVMRCTDFYAGYDYAECQELADQQTAELGISTEQYARKLFIKILNDYDYGDKSDYLTSKMKFIKMRPSITTVDNGRVMLYVSIKTDDGEKYVAMEIETAMKNGYRYIYLKR